MATNKIAILIFIIVVCKYQESSGIDHAKEHNPIARIGEDMFMEFVENMKAKMITGDPDSGIPPMDPWNLGHLPLNLTALGIIEGNLALSETVIAGIPYLEITNLKITGVPTRFSMTITFNELSVNARYSGYLLVLDMLKLYGTGILSVEIQNFSFDLIADRIITDPCLPIKFKSITLPRISVDGIKTRFTGLFGDSSLSEMISDDLGDVLAEFLNEKHTWLNQLLSTPLTELINSIMPYSLNDILNPGAVCRTRYSL